MVKEIEKNFYEDDNEEERSDFHDLLESSTYGGGVPLSSGFTFRTNRGHAQYDDEKHDGQKKIEKKRIFHPVSDITQVPTKQQRRIRNALNMNKPPEEHILYKHIKPGSPTFKKKYAKMVVAYFNAKEYVRFSEENEKPVFSLRAELSEPEVLSCFQKISKPTRKKLMMQLDIPLENVSECTLENKRKVVAAYENQKLEKTLERQFNMIPKSVQKEILHDVLHADPQNIRNYSKENKKKIVRIFNSQY